ncbi:hypothetical protein CDD80_4175 [Ophiocordyceps camponoti-rufipedis]|uniref:Extracellular membrane protein CFEM domain-containing protein n=1 Tax=Ophiocordyceps camponoti-rufipedis TaxID=2004952 RepID=A0A2C5XHU5_9HYPO|nr:hypothetical protein CDD80_4175 [Ophiocordyceps camponoti-rufipedis]
MKFTIFALSLAGLVSAASAAESSMNTLQAGALDIGQLLGGLKPLLKKAKCIAPCITSKVDALKCEDGGPLTTICKHVDDINKESEPCAKKCGVDKSMGGTILKVVKDLCKSHQKSKDE